MKKLLILCLILVFCIAGCTEKIDPVPTVSSGIVDDNTKKIEIVKDADKFSTLNIFEDCEHSFTNTENEVVILATSAEVDEDGYFMWDDSQEWVLYVKNDEGVYPLYEESLHGMLSLNVSEHYLDNGGIEDVIRLTISGSAGFEIREYKFCDGVFTENIAYTTGAINELSVNKYY